MRVVVAGATGAIGVELTRQLVAARHDVVGITRSAAGASRLRDAGATAVVADVLDRPVAVVCEAIAATSETVYGPW